MIAALPLFRSVLRDQRGAMAIETAFIVPILMIMTFGGFEVSYMVARQSELRTAAAEAVALALATEQGTTVSTEAVEEIIVSSTGLDADDVTITTKYRCDAAEELVATKGECTETAVVSTFLIMEMSETYSPQWTDFGIGEDIDYTIERTMQVG